MVLSKRDLQKIMRYLKDAHNAAELSTCIRRQYGAVIVKDDRPLSSGYNGAAVGSVHCTDRGICFREEHGIPHGTQYEQCQAIHAEENAMYRTNWLEMQGATMYLFGLQTNDDAFKSGETRSIDARPCDICIKRIKTNGLSKVVCGNADGTFHIIHLDG